jgi:hypothetical protein
MPFNKSLPDHERRYAPRRRIKIPFRFEIRNSELAPDWENLMQRTETDNVSKAGLFFQTHLQLKIGARLDMTIAMPGENGSQWACCGHVRRNSSSWRHANLKPTTNSGDSTFRKPGF